MAPARAAGNLVPDPSFEEPMERDRWGHVFAHWSGWIYEGECEFRVSDLARTGGHSLLLVGGNQPKIRAWPRKLVLEPGRYRVVAHLRGLDIGTGRWNQTTEFMFAGVYLPLGRNGTFGWTRLTYVGEVKEPTEGTCPSFGLMAPGRLWVDDVTVEKVGDDTALTPVPVFGAEEAPIAPPGPFGAGAARCPDCGYRAMPAWGSCYACGAALAARPAASGPPVRVIASFEDGNPFDGGVVVSAHATDGAKALRIDRGYASMDGPQDWTGYDWIKVDVHTDADRPLKLYFEVRDTETRDYWTRVNYTTVVPPGSGTLAIPAALYVGEKSRPGRPLNRRGITRIVFSIGADPPAPLFLDRLRLERDTSAEAVRFEGLWAFDLGTRTSPVMEGFTPLDMSCAYTAGRGYGWKNARFWRAFDALQPDPLYQDFICVEAGGLAIDVPNGRYRVIVNMDSPSGYWGEVQRYRRRVLRVEGRELVDTMDLEAFMRRYYRSWDRDDLPAENAFDTYQLPYFAEKDCTVDVDDGQLNVEFEGANWACCVSAVIVFPAERDAQGDAFLDFVRARRRFHFDNAFKRVLHSPSGVPPVPSPEERRRGYIVFARDWMEDVFDNDMPREGERVATLSASAFAGELEPVTLSVFPLEALGPVTVTPGDLAGPGGAVIPARAIATGYVRHRLARVTMEGSVYTIAPRFVVPRSTAPMPPGFTRTFWLTVAVPPTAAPGLYRGALAVAAAGGAPLAVPLEVRVRRGTLDPVDIPVGPWGHTIDLPWEGPEAAARNRRLAAASLRKLREYGFTTASGLPVVRYLGCENGSPRLDFSRGDAQMRLFKEHGFRMSVVTYCPLEGLETYYKDSAAMQAAGFTDYPAFIRAVFGAIQRHAEAAEWLPVYWNIGDEPVGDDLARSAENAEAYRAAFPQGPPFFTAATSFVGADANDPRFRLSRALHVADWNLHDEASVRLLRDAGGAWAFYNGGNRWTFGVYLYKAVAQHGMRFRLSWHWNAAACDPYYALDCRQDDYAWCSASPEGELIPSLEFERLREGLDDYRRLATLARLARENPGAEAAGAAEACLREILASFRLGERDMNDGGKFKALRARLEAAIEQLR